MSHFTSNLHFAIPYSILKLAQRDFRLHALSDLSIVRKQEKVVVKRWLQQVFMPSSIVIRKLEKGSANHLRLCQAYQVISHKWFTFKLEVGSTKWFASLNKG